MDLNQKLLAGLLAAFFLLALVRIFRGPLCLALKVLGNTLLGFLALCIHWFNPLVWLAFSLACKDMEMSCDEAVLKTMGAQIRGDYAASLLKIATGRKAIVGGPLAFGEGDPKSRIKNLARWTKPVRMACKSG